MCIYNVTQLIKYLVLVNVFLEIATVVHLGFRANFNMDETCAAGSGECLPHESYCYCAVIFDTSGVEDICHTLMHDVSMYTTGRAITSLTYTLFRVFVTILQVLIECM